MNRKAISLIEVLVVILIIVVLVAILAPGPFWHGGAREIANRSVSGANLRGIFMGMIDYAEDNNKSLPIAADSAEGNTTGFKAMFTNSITNEESFPIAGEFAEGNIIGFKARSLRGQANVKSNNSNLINNGTASLWLLVRNGSFPSKSFINPSSNDSKDELKDTNGKTVALSETWDFLHADGNNGRKTLSYSFINMYHKDRKKNWSANASSNWVLMGDDNNADDETKGNSGKAIHSLSKAMTPTQDQIEGSENSTNHGQDGQSFVFGDGHVEFSTDPFVGPKSDNVYAKDTSTDDPDSSTYTEKPAPPTLDCTDEWTQPQRDVMLIPLTGNHGVNLSDTGRYK